jgi:hypothetical protein
VDGKEKKRKKKKKRKRKKRVGNSIYATQERRQVHSLVNSLVPRYLYPVEIREISHKLLEDTKGRRRRREDQFFLLLLSLSLSTTRCEDYVQAGGLLVVDWGKTTTSH